MTTRTATREQVATLFPRASRSCLEANAAVSSKSTTEYSQNIPEKAKERRPKQTKTEAAFERILEARKARGEIISYQFHGVTIRWSDGTAYSPDFLVLEKFEGCEHHRIVLYEVKGGWLYPGAKRRFKEARDNCDWAQFEMWQKKAGNWTRLL